MGMAEERSPEEASEREVEAEAAAEPDDPITRREEVEQDLMEEGRSEAGEHLP
jgi:hypothetical protein